MKSTLYKSYIAIIIAIIGGMWVLFTDNTYNKLRKVEQEPFVVLLQMISIFSIGWIVSLIIICFSEKCSNCICHLETKSLSNIVKKFTARSQHVIIVTLIAGFFCGIINYVWFDASWNLTSTFIGIFMFASFLLSQEPTKIEISTMWEDNNINVGYGLASQFFYGYIKLLMSADLEWEQRIKRYSSEQGVPIFGKLILLLPKSCQVKNILTEVDRRIIFAQNLHPKFLRLSGLVREFKNTVYKIDEGMRFVAEYPPPLSTIQDMCFTGVGHHLTSDEKREQTIIFMHHLQELVKNDPYCSSNCLIIPYDDTAEETLSEIIDRYITIDQLERARAAG